MNKIICYLFGHMWLYNFSYKPNLRICIGCYKKQFASNTKYPKLYPWIDIKQFKFTKGCKKTDLELIKSWLNK